MKKNQTKNVKDCSNQMAEEQTSNTSKTKSCGGKCKRSDKRCK